jgi:hypothetical protein
MNGDVITGFVAAMREHGLEPAASPVHPMKSDQRWEVVAIMMGDEAAGDGGASISIERDETGTAYAGQIDIDCGQCVSTDCDRIFCP